MADLGKDSKAGCNEGECEINHREPAKLRGKIPIVMIKNIKNRRDIFKAMYLCGLLADGVPKHVLGNEGGKIQDEDQRNGMAKTANGSTALHKFYKVQKNI